VPSVEGEVRFRRVGLLVEWTGLDVGEDASAAGGRIPATIDLDGTIATVAASWRFVGQPGWFLEALAGGRYVSVEADVAVPGAPTVTADQDWGDPLVGLRGAVALSDRLTLDGRGSVGGFGVGSDVTWEARGRLAFLRCEHVGLAAGYRHLDVEYEEGDITIDFALTGPFLALDLVF